jgi:hypothetical protein
MIQPLVEFLWAIIWNAFVFALPVPCFAEWARANRARTRMVTGSRFMKYFATRAPLAMLASAMALIGLATAASAATPVTVSRGAESTVVHPAEGGLVVARGAPVVTQPPKHETFAAVPDVVAAGWRIWMIDAKAGRLKTCSEWRTTQVGERVIRCIARDLPE